VGAVALRAAALPLALAGWWYVVLLSETGSPLGSSGPIAAAPGPPFTAAVSIWFVDFDSAWEWLSQAYFSYWVFQFPYEPPPLDGWELVPLAGIAVGLAGLLKLAIRARASLLDPLRPTLRQAVALASAPVGVTLPFFLLDMRRADQGMGFLVATGRFSLAAYSAVATLLVLALCELAGRRQAVQCAAVGTAVAVSLAYYVHTYAVWGLERYYAPLDDVLSRAIWDKPRWVTEGFLEALIAMAAISFVGAVVATVIGSRRERRLSGSPSEAGAVAAPT
jgi:hypothetical protein